jgi:hypothetical protein
MRVDRTVVEIKSIGSLTEHEDDFCSFLLPDERLSFVWELTKEVYSFGREFNAESRLQRNIVHIFRRES